MKTKIKRFITWAALNSILGWLIWLAINGNVGASRLLAFAAWLIAICYLITAGSPEIRDVAKLDGRSVPAWISHAIGILGVSTLIWHGFWMTGIAFLIIDMAEFAIFQQPKQKDPNQ